MYASGPPTGLLHDLAKDGVRMTLIQVKRADFDLPDESRADGGTPKGAAVGKSSLDVLIWTSAGVRMGARRRRLCRAAKRQAARELNS